MNHNAYQQQYISPVPDRYAEVPPGVVPVNMLTDQQLIGLGLDPTDLRRMEDELSQMGLGLGISIGGIFRGIKKGVKGVAKGVFKVGKFAVKTAVKAAPIVLPAAGAAFLAVRYGPKVVSAASKMFRKRPDQLTEAEARTAQEAVVKAANGRQVPAIAPPAPSVKEDRPSILEKIKDVVVPLIPQVAERITEVAQRPPAIPETAVAAAEAALPPAERERIIQAGMQPPAAGGIDPKTLLMAAPLLLLPLMMGRGR